MPYELRAVRHGESREAVEVRGHRHDRERVVGDDIGAEDAADEPVERGAGVGDAALVGDEIVLRLGDADHCLHHVESRGGAGGEARLGLLEEVGGELARGDQVLAVLEGDEE